MTIYQVFCTVDEVLREADSRGVYSEKTVFDKVLAASRLLAMKTGRFLPVTETRTFGADRASSIRLFLRFPLISISSIVNDGVTLGSDDYVLQPNGRHWDNGPYSMLEVAANADNLSAWDDDNDGIVIVGDVGLYDATELLSATLGADLTDSGKTMRVSNGALVSPGMMVKVESERIFVKASSTPVAAVTTISAALDANAETCTFADGSLLNVGEVFRIGVEQIKVLDLNGNAGALQRGWNKTTKSAHTINSNVDVYRNFSVERGANGSTAAAHANASAITKYLLPEDVNGLCRKIAMRMLKDASAGYAGRVGDETMGQAVYTYVLPYELDEIMNNYEIPFAG